MAGNDCFDAQRNDQAKNEYQLAKERAKTLFAAWFDPHEAIAAVVISHHNLADLYLAEGNTDQAEAELRQAHQFIHDALLDPNCDLERKDALLHGGRRTYLALLDHIKTHGSAYDEPLTSPMMPSA